MQRQAQRPPREANRAAGRGARARLAPAEPGLVALVGHRCVECRGRRAVVAFRKLVARATRGAVPTVTLSSCVALAGGVDATISDEKRTH